MLNRGLDKLELLRIVEAVANEKSIDKELVIGSMESAIQKAALTKFGNDNNIEVNIQVKLPSRFLRCYSNLNIGPIIPQRRRARFPNFTFCNQIFI